MNARRAAAALLAASTLAGCATTGEVSGQRNPSDPWEGWNRKVYAFNESLDAAVLKPVATAYVDVVPRPVRKGIDNVIGNFSDAWSALNNMLQGKVGDGLHDVMRVGTNTFFGFLGVLDIATEMGLERHGEDFGQTLGVWGVPTGPYMVLPALGPSTVRESLALPLDRAVSPQLAFADDASKVGVTVLGVVNARANLLGASRVLDDIALDKYTFVRDAYLQRRRSLVYDGDPPPQDEPAPEPAAPAASAASAPK